MNDKHSFDVVEKWFDGAAEMDEAESAEFNRLMAANASARERVVELAALSVGLREACSNKNRGEPALAKRRRLWWAAAAAAALFIAVLGASWIYWGSGKTRILEGTVAQALSGFVIVGGDRVRNVPEGAVFEVPAGASVPLRLNDGSKVTVESGARISIQEHVGAAREVITLTSGAATFEVTRDSREFRIETATGQVHVVGTHFRVAAAPAESVIKNGTFVEVTEGIVHVNFGKTSEDLKAGGKMCFVRTVDGRDGVMVTGSIAILDVAGKKISLDGRLSYRLSLRMTVLIDGKGAPVGDLAVGQNVKLVLASGGTEAIAIFATTTPK